MQQPHRYPSHRQLFAVTWHARAGATVNDDPLPPRTAARTRAIRAIFLRDFAGCASIDEVGAAAEDAGLLDRLGTPRSMRETVMAALRPVASSHVWENLARPGVSPPLPPG